MIPIGIDESEKKSQIFEMRKSVLKAEQERLKGDKTLSVAEAKKVLRERTL